MWRWKRYPYYSVQSRLVFPTEIVTSYLFISMRGSLRILKMRENNWKIVFNLSQNLAIQSKDWGNVVLSSQLLNIWKRWAKKQASGKRPHVPSPGLQNSTFFIRPTRFSFCATLAKKWSNLLKEMNFPCTSEITVLWCVELRSPLDCLAPVIGELLLLLQNVTRWNSPEDTPYPEIDGTAHFALLHPFLNGFS